MMILLRGEAVVITAPLGVLQAGVIGFTPALPPPFSRALARLCMGLLDAVVLHFDACFWPPDKHRFCLMPGVGPRRGYFQEWMNGRRFTTGGANVLVGYVATSEAGRLEALTDEAVAAEAMTALRLVFPEAPDPVHVTVSRWGADPWSRGSYSHCRVGVSPAKDFAALRGPYYGGRLVFAGEHMSKDSHSTLHGAFTSGQWAADALGKGQEGKVTPEKKGKQGRGGKAGGSSAGRRGREDGGGSGGGVA
jgi:monoamine oxidase